jgi:large subunit ribosomal protein L4
MAGPTAPALDAAGKRAGDVELEGAVFGAEVKPHLVHETVRAEMAAARAGTRAAKSRGMVAGGSSKPWRQKGTGRARAGTTRAPQWTGGGVAFPPAPRAFDLKVNRKARKAALRGALSDHAARGALAVVDGALLGDTPSTKGAVAFLAEWGRELPLLVVAAPEEEALAKSFRNIDGVLVLDPSTLEVGAVVWARSLLLTEAALARVQEIAQ